LVYKQVDDTHYAWGIQNAGHTPAIIESVSWSMALLLHDQALSPDPVYAARVEVTPFVLAPQESWQFIDFDIVPKTIELGAIWEEVRTKLKVAFFFCSIQYRSVIATGVPSETRYIRKYVPLEGFIPFDSPAQYSRNT
jgi:hypothetical protein